MFQSRLAHHLKLKYPIVQAPCAPYSLEPLVAAVSNAGGLGSLSAALHSPDKIRDSIREIKRLTDKPFAVNLFAPHFPQPTPDDFTNKQRYTSDDILDNFRKELGAPCPERYTPRSFPFEDQLNVVLEERCPVLSFTFGQLPNGAIAKLKQAGIYVIGTATTVYEAKVLVYTQNEQDAVDAIIAQGSEINNYLKAGGHRGKLRDTKIESQLGTMSLLPQVVDAVGAKVPVLAAGGISDARSLYASFVLGADAACLGTLFMLTKETKLPDYHRNALLSASPDATQLTRAFTGRYARGITNRFMDTMHKKCLKEEDIPNYDIHSARTMDIFAKAKADGKGDEYCSMWAGQSFGVGREFTNKGTLSAAETIQKLVAGVENLSKQSFAQQ
ncbi:hypothetical protein NQZ79_g3318 [Umbelopsis isabellina]|nr:hypothetical protein NQZ79_g3318 [Umbelopsis isabellina]